MLNPFLALAAWALVLVGGPVDGAELQPNVTVLSDDLTYDVNGGGTYTMDEALSVRVNTDQGVKSRGQIAFPYSASLQDLEVLRAYTTTRGGERIEVAPDKILEQPSPQSKDAPMFDDGKLKIVVFPAVEVGSILTVRVRKIQRKPLFPGHFSVVEVASSDDEYKSARITVRAPESLKLFVDAVDMQGGQHAPDKPGTQVWRWSIENVPARRRENGAVGAMDRSPRVAVSSFAGYEAVGAAYAERAKAQARVTPSIQRLADQLTRGIAGQRAQAEALYRWVSANLRYVAIFLDVGGVVPRPAQDILEAKYGDCKDHATLLEALLAAKGIRSSPVLVNATDTYWLPKAAVAPGVFNHAISYLPELKVFLDSSAAVAMFGTLPVGEQGKPALIVDDGTGSARIVTLPLGTPDTDRVEGTTRMTIDPEGTVKGKTEVVGTGAFDVLARQVFASLSPGAETQVAARVLTMTGQHGSGLYQHGDVRNLAAPLVYTTEFTLPNYVQLPGPGAMAVPQGLGSFSGISAALESFAPESRQLPFPFSGRRVVEKLSIELPEGFGVASLPKPVTTVTPFGSYKSSYAIDHRVVTVTRSLDLHLTGPLIQVQDYPALRAMALTVARDLRAQLVYQN